MGIAETMRRLVTDELARRNEPWARKFFDPDAGEPHPEVVDTLAQVALGLERDSAGTPLSDDAFREQLAAWVVDTVLVNPNLPKTSYRPQFQTGVRVRIEASGVPAPSGRTLDTLAELALGAYEDTHPRAMRIAAPNLIVNEYLRGAAVVVAAPPPAVRAAAVPARPATPRRAPAQPRAAAQPARPEPQTAAKPAQPKPRAAAKARTKARTKARAGTAKRRAARSAKVARTAKAPARTRAVAKRTRRAPKRATGRTSAKKRPIAKRTPAGARRSAAARAKARRKKK